jgi:signal transduction histidine kinase/DNA-binding response OmpR family regulator/ligand-binding sensor domain-containing protein
MIKIMEKRLNFRYISQIFAITDYQITDWMDLEKYKVLKLALLLLFLRFLVAGSQNYSKLHFERIDNTHRMTSEEVLCSNQDKSGFIWFGTSEGAVRYDGYEFNSFKKHKYLGKLFGIRINNIHVDDVDNLYFTSNEGFFAFNSCYEPILPTIIEYFKGRDLNDIYVASDSTVYISSQRGFYVIDPLNEKVTELKAGRDSGMLTSVTKEIVEDAKGRIWVATWGNHILKLNKEKKSFQVFNIFNEKQMGGSKGATNSLFIDSRGYLWVGCWEMGLAVVDIGSDNNVNILKWFKHQSGVDSSISGNIIRSISEDKYNVMWVGTPNGLSSIKFPLSNRHSIINYKPEEKEGAFHSGVITSLFNDNSDILWITSKGGGVYKLIIEQDKFSHYKIPDLNKQNHNQEVQSFELDDQGRVLAGVLSMGFVVYDRGRNKYLHYVDVPEYQVIDKEIKLNTVRCFMWDQDSVLWLGTRHNGLVLLNPQTGQVDVVRKRIKKKDFKGREINVIKKLNNGSVLVGTDEGINHLRIGKGGIWRSEVVDLSEIVGLQKANISVTGIEPVDKNVVFVSTERNGLFKLVFNKGKATAELYGNMTDKVICLFKDSDQRIWIGTRGNGLKYILNKEDTVIHSLAPESYIIGDVIYGINQDMYNDIWVTTNKGLTKIEGDISSFESESYYARGGLQGNIFIERAFFKDKDGQFYIGGYNGFNIFEPNRIKSDQSISPIVITEIQVEGEVINEKALVDSTLFLNHIKNDFSIEFASLSYIYPDANQYAYMVEGLDKDWKYVDANKRSANYSNIGTGEYVFKLKGTNSQGAWNDHVLKLRIVVKAAPYKRWWAICLYILGIVLILGIVFKLRLHWERMKKKAELEQMARIKSEKLNQYKLRFFTNISHELLTPVSILSSSLYNIKHGGIHNSQNISVMERNVLKLERMIRQLLTFRKVDANKVYVNISEKNISSLIINIVNDFESLYVQKGLKILLQIEENINGKIDKEKWEIIIRNLLSNAIKYTDEGQIVVGLKSIDSGGLSLIVKDTGCGIPQEALSKLFNRFYRVKSEKSKSEEGIGIGLNLTKNLVDILGGSIDVESEEGKGTAFKLFLPIDGVVEVTEDTENKVFSSIKDIDIDGEGIQKDIPEENRYAKNYELLKDTTILLVEDNDEFRQSVKLALGQYASILEARDGSEGIKLAEDKDIDIVISDVMMPGKKGYELCKEMKDNIKTSHIPVVLLTAKVGDDNKIIGYQSGADAYVEKPVNIDLLILRINVLLQNRKKLRHNTGINLNLEPENVSVTPLDEAFFNQAKKIVEANIADADYSIKEFADDLGVSNSMLYRKIKNLADSSPSEFVRNIRIKRSAQLLENKAFSISEVAYNCGFNDLSYFGVCFKKMYGVTPTAYQAGEGQA